MALSGGEFTRIGASLHGVGKQLTITAKTESVSGSTGGGGQRRRRSSRCLDDEGSFLMRYILALPLVVFLSSCSLVMSGKDVDEQIKFMQQSNHSGCARLTGSGTPPASRVDGEIIGSWGQETKLIDCINYFKGGN